MSPSSFIPQEIETLVHSVVDQESIIAITDRTGTIVYANDRFCEISGYGRNELVGQNHRILRSGVHDAAFYKHLWATILSGRVWRGEICNRAKDGHRYWVETVISPLRSQGLITHFLALRTDITAWKRDQELLAEQRRREEEDRKMAALGRLADGVLHDLGNVLTGVMGMAAEARTAERDRMLQDSIGRMAQLTRTLREYSTGRPREAEPFRLNTLLSCACSLVRYRQGVPRNLTILQSVETTADWEIVGNEGQVFEVVLNLVVNAAEAVARQSQPQVVVRSKVAAGRVCVDVEDNGPGVPAAIAGSLFELYQSTKGPGRGVGLSVARRIALAHGGDLRLDRAGDDGSGARFVLELPARHNPAGAPAGGPAALGDRRIVLVSEDDLEVRRTIEQAAGQAGFTTLFAGDAADLLALAAKTTGVLAATVVDSCDLESDSGTVACLRRATPGTPILLVSATLRQRGVQQTPWGPVRCLPKPFTCDELAAVLQEAASPAGEGI